MCLVYKENMFEYDANFIFIAVPTNSIRDALNQVSLSQDTPVISLSKGIERNTHNYPSEIILNSTNLLKSSICSLSGPSHAEEVSSRIPTAVVIAGTNVTLNKKVQELMSCSTFRVYSNTDLKGVEIAGALKNVISIASGICIGLQFGDNTIAALITRGLNEIVRLGNIYDADMSTFYGLAGIGDLSVTAFSQYSRNRKFGIDIGRGVSPEESIESMGMVVEGYYTIDALHEIIVANNLEMPISNSIYEILYNNLSPKQAIMELMNRTLTHENN